MRRLPCSNICTSFSLLRTRSYRIQTFHYTTTSDHTQPTTPPTSKFSINIKDWIPPATSQPIERDLKKQPIPSTRKWTIEEMKFFNLHYYQVSTPALWSTYFCDEVPMRPALEDIAISTFDADDIIQGINYDVAPFTCHQLAFINKKNK